MSALTPIVLAGGSGTRMWPIKKNKLLLPFLGQPFLARVIDQLVKGLGVKPVLVVSPELQEELKSSGWVKDCRLVVQPESLGMGDAVLRVSAQLGSGPALIVNGNDFLLADFIADFVNQASQFSGGALPAVRVDKYFPGGYLKVEDQRVMAVVEKPGEGKEPSNLVKPVLDYFARLTDFVDALEKESAKNKQTDDLYERALTNLLSQKKFGWVELKESWRSLKYPWDVLGMMNLVFESSGLESSSKPELAANVTVEGPVYFSPGVRVFEGAKIKGPVYLGRGVIVGNNALVRESMVGAGSVIGFGTEIARSWVGEGCWFHSNYIGDSVIGPNCSFGAGTVTGNLRLDEEVILSVVKGKKIPTQRRKLGTITGPNCRFGANATLMPGIKVGADCQIGPGVILRADLEDNQACFALQEQKIVKNRVKTSPDRADFRKKVK